MQARSALFDLYGDHLRGRGGAAPVAALVRLLAPLHIAGPAVRTAVSRMVRQGWLTPVATDGGGRGYGLTDRAVRRLDEAAARIYRSRPVDDWDGQWSVAVVEHTPDRTRRERLHRALEYLGYRPLQPGSWVAPRPAPELESVVASEGLTVTEFRGEQRGDDVSLVERLYQPAALASAYVAWLADARRLVTAAGDDPSPDAAFAVRSRLVHEWRKFLFRDPGLPLSLLPPDWPGTAAAGYFDAESARLLPGASAFVDCCLSRREP
jgi:phenylacetic acid degradation operon negative regulatory protein